MSVNIYKKKLKKRENLSKLKPKTLAPNSFTCSGITFSSGDNPLYFGPDIFYKNNSVITFFGNGGGYLSQLPSGYSALTSSKTQSTYKEDGFLVSGDLQQCAITFTEDRQVELLSVNVTFTLLRVDKAVDDSEIIFYLNYYEYDNGVPYTSYINNSEVSIKLTDLNSSTKPAVYNDMNKTYTVQYNYPLRTGTPSPSPLLAAAIALDNNMRITGYIDACVQYKYIS